MTAAKRSWDPGRLIHRQTYIDLIGAYLADYGTQRDLARALGVSEVYVSYLLRPLSLTADGPPAHWSVLLSAAGYEVREALKFAKTPSQARAGQIVAALGSDAERRDALLYYISRARGRARPAAAVLSPLTADAASVALAAVGREHQDALYDSAESVAAASYARVWDGARPLPARIDPRSLPVDHAQALMFLHDTAQVLGRADLALGFARRALGVLPQEERGNAIAYGATRLRVNALLAEAVSLNTLGLRTEAYRACAYAESLVGFRDEPETWLRSFLEQRLTALSGMPRAPVYTAERTAEQALELVAASAVQQAGIRRRLMDVYVARHTTRTVRKAATLAPDLEQAAARGSGMSPLRRAQILRTLARFYSLTEDRRAAARAAAECLRVTGEARLVHQRAELIRELASLP